MNIKNSIDAVNMLNEIRKLRDLEGDASHRNGLEQALAILEDRNPDYVENESQPISDEEEAPKQNEVVLTPEHH